MTDKQNDISNASKDEQIGFHKGSLSTLSKERQELTRLVSIVEQLMQMHIGALNDLGVDLQKDVSASPGSPKKKKPIDEML